MLDSLHAQAPFEMDEQDGLDPLYYFQILKKRKFYGLIPFICIFAIGFAIVMLWPPTYQSEGKILVESQQIPVDLVRPTVTATASERIATIQQRVMTRDNLLKIVDKYQLFADQRVDHVVVTLGHVLADRDHADRFEFRSLARGSNQHGAVRHFEQWLARIH
jgi:hypothetical protein